MKRLIASLLALGLAAASTAAFAQSGYDRYDAPHDGRYDDGYRDAYGTGDGETYYDEARVIRVDPVLEGGYRSVAGDGRRCYETTTAGGYRDDGYDPRSDRYDDDYGRRPYGDNASRSMATIAGGVIGAVLGNQVGGGSGRFAATTVGTMVGGIAGRQIYDQTQRGRYERPATVRVCDPEPVRGGYSRHAGGASAYDVTYEYNGRRYTRRMDYHPGDRVRVRVEVMPD